jgi:PKD repeat protein
VAADLPTLQYAFDCGSGYGAFSPTSTASCTAPSSDFTVRGQVRDKDGGISQYTATVTVAAATVRPDPFSVPAHNESTFVIDHDAAGLDTGCSSAGDHSLTITLPVNRVIGDLTTLLRKGLLAPTVVLKMPAYDIAFAGGNGINPERNRVYFNDHLVPTQFLSGASGTWQLNTFVIPSEWVNFPPDPLALDSSKRGLPPLVPQANTIRIDIDTGNTKTFSCTSIDWVSLSVQVARPVLLVHGILSDHKTWETIWVANLRGLGLPVATIDVGKLGSIQDNAAKIRDRVDQLRSAWGVERINIGSHSKGGLDSRDYIEHRDTVASLVQIAPPNAGSPLASLIQKGIFKIPVVGGILVGIVDLLFPAAYQLTPQYMGLYNSFHGHNPNTIYTSLAGDYRFGGFLGKIPNYILSRFYGGPNDLVVPASSVYALPYARHLVYQSKGGNHQAWHASLPLMAPCSPNNFASETCSPDIYNILIPFFKTPGAVLPKFFLASAAAPQLGSPVLQFPEALDDTGSVLSTKTIVGTILQGETRTETLYMDGTQPISLMLYHGTGELRLTLISPSGVRIDPTTPATNSGVAFETLAEEDGLHVLMYGIETPEAGAWTLEVSAPSVVNPSGQEPYFLTGLLIDPPIRLTAATDQTIYHRGEPVIFHATFRNGTAPIAGAQVVAGVVGPDQTPSSLTLSDDGTGDDQVAHDGIYSGRFSATTIAGLYQVVVTGTGPAAQPVTREELLLVPVSASTSRLNGTFSDSGADTDSDGLFNDLVVQVGMDVTTPRSYRMLGELADANGELIATATALADLDAGTGTVSLRFDGASIYKHGVDGPYLLRVVRVAEDDGSAILPLDERLNAYMTAGYDHRQFQHPALAARDQSVTTDEDTPIELTLDADSAEPAALTFSVVNNPSHGVLSGTAPHLTYTPEANFNGSDVFTFDVSNGTIDSELATVFITVNPVNDPPALAPIPDLAMDESATARIAVSASDLDGDDLKLTLTGLPAFASLTDNGDGTGAIVLTPGFNAAGTYRAVVTVSDGSSTATAPFTLTVNNVNRPPVANAGGPYTADEGDRVTLDASRSADPDADGAIVRYEWDLDNDGAYDDATGATPTTVFEDQGIYLVGLRVTDDQGAQAVATAQVTVRNVPPSVGPISAPLAPTAVNATVAVSAPFSDPGLRDTHTAVWDWNDSTTSTGTVVEGGSAGSVSGSHVYKAAGVYTVSLTVTDKDGAAGTALFKYVVIYDPNGGFVTGGGWFISPAGSYPGDPGLTDRANFGFVSRYQTGASVPVGQTQFDFRVADLTFHSDSYQWLVITGARAQYKGIGKINGAGSYGLLITAIDGQADGGGGIDRVRVKIWDKTNGRVIYDSQAGAPDDANPTTAVQGGAIVVHSH